MKIMKEYRVPVRSEKESKVVFDILKSMHVFAWGENFLSDDYYRQEVVFRADPVRYQIFKRKYGQVLFQERMES